jgi:hypothetical protein
VGAALQAGRLCVEARLEHAGAGDKTCRMVCVHIAATRWLLRIGRCSCRTATCLNQSPGSDLPAPWLHSSVLACPTRSCSAEDEAGHFPGLTLVKPHAAVDGALTQTWQAAQKFDQLHMRCLMICPASSQAVAAVCVPGAGHGPVYVGLTEACKAALAHLRNIQKEHFDSFPCKADGHAELMVMQTAAV